MCAGMFKVHRAAGRVAKMGQARKEQRKELCEGKVRDRL